ncbi:hypothetical protein MLD38_038367 [Melastoma candidum]|uniref:Uncharacterized protein n=1 Tax=Melastoma candidum TaxID=119954 RepID=A0ACB9KZW4_9MYRT|nr:hypothetical protein MLD38_038367 [Melastoma candidum]
MGNRHRLRLSELMSSGSWLYNKLTLNHTKPRSGSPSPRLKPKAKPRAVTAAAAPAPLSPTDSNPRKSYHFGRELNPGQNVKSPRRTRKLQADAKCSLSSSASSASNTTTTTTTTCFSPLCRGSRRPSPGFRFDRVLTPDPVDKTTSPSSPSSSRSLSDPDLVDRDIAVGVVKLAQIVTTKKKNERKSSTANSPGVRLRTHSPRLLATAKRTQARKAAAVRPRRTGHESNGKCRGFAVVKSSLDPWKDFRESMVEMIVENGIKDSKGLEELLACYLSLNSEEYHEVIVAVFKQIWCDLTDITFA